MLKRSIFIGTVTTMTLVGCGGGGASAPATSGSGSGSGATTTASVSGDMLALAPNRGFNYQGTLASGTHVTLTLYTDPSSGGATPLVLLAASGTEADASTGSKAAAIVVAKDGSTGTQVLDYTLYDGSDNITASGALPSITLLVPATLTQGQTFAPYPGMTATVTDVGSVTGESGCPKPGNGATVQYGFQGQTYSISYVPGCGITHYAGNNGESFTLTSIATYSLGTLGDVTAMKNLTLLDNVRSAIRIIIQGRGFAFWHPGTAR